jgi:dTDP-4-amino-4,6-dideoxygalactose transaminase
MESYRIPFNKPFMVGAELGYIADAVHGGQLSGDGRYTQKCHSLLQEALDAQKVLLTTSCTHALEMAAILLETGPGTEVIVPTFTFVSTANAFTRHGARPVFADSRPDTLNIDEAQLDDLITHRTKAIVAMHYAGVGCDMDTIMAVADRHHIAVVEDNAHGLFGQYRNRHLGTFGRLATLSFHETKNFICGEGGALILNDPALNERAEILREKGTNRSQFSRGEVDKYTWVDVGSSYLPSDVLAAFLYAQLQAREDILANRRRIWNRYRDSLRRWCAETSVRRGLAIVTAEGA